MPPSGAATRLALIEAATRLFAAEGVEGPSMDAIVRAAGAKNASAVSYHFGSRADLLVAVLAHHRDPIDARRRDLLAQRGGADVSLAFLAELTIDPLIDHLGEPSGAEYLRIRAELLGRGDLDALIDGAPLLLQAAAEPFMESESSLTRHRRELVTVLVFGGLADFARRHPDASLEARRGFGEILRRAMVAVSCLTLADSPS